MISRIHAMLDLNVSMRIVSAIQGDTIIYLIEQDDSPVEIPLKVKKYEDSIVHIGLYLFDMLEEYQTGATANFLERQLLYYVLVADEQLPAMLENHRVKVHFNGQPFGGPGFSKLETVVQSIRDKTSFALTHDADNYEFSFSDDNSNRVAISFPGHAWLIEGKEKDELDSALLNQLNTPFTGELNYAEYRQDELKRYSEKVWVWEHSSLSEGVSRDMYLIQRENHWELLRDPDFIRESLSNMLLQAAPEDHITLDLSYEGFGKTKRRLSIPYLQLFGHLHERHDLYVTFTKQTADTLFASVVWMNRSYGHLHLLKIQQPIREFEPGRQVTLKAIFYPYIRRDNLYRLFGEKH